MTYRFALDKDSDVRSFVMSFVDPDILEKQREKEMKAAVQVAEAAIEARAEENSNFDEDEEEDEEDEDDDEEEEDHEEHQDKKMALDETEEPMQVVIEKEGSPEKKCVKAESMDMTNGIDEDEVMSDVDTASKTMTKKPLSTTTTAVVLPRSSTEG
jgi:ABC-type Zn2+ transport system substrate-binding protein/surface adhesin